MDIDDLEKDLGLSSDDDNDNSNDELEDIINLLNSSEDDIIRIKNDTEIFEGLSQEELDLLMKQDEELDISDIDTEVMNDISIYGESEETPSQEDLDQAILNVNDEEIEENNEGGVQQSEQSDEQENKISQEDFMKLIQQQENGENDFLEFVEAPKKDKKSKKNKNKKLSESSYNKLIVFGIVFLSVLIGGTAMFFIIAIQTINNKNIQAAIEQDNNIAAKYNPEDKNTVYVDMAQNIDDETLILEKVHINQSNTTFYFKNKIEPMKYNIILTDANENLYPMDLNFTQDGKTGNSILRFDSIVGESKDLKLIFKSIVTGKEALFNLNFDANLSEEKVSYINSKIKNNFGDFNININYAEFGDTSSRIDYIIEPFGEVKYQIQQGILNEKDSVKLKENNKYIEELSNNPVSTSIDNKIIGRMDFKNIKDKNNNTVLEFNNIYKKYPLNKKVTLNEVKNGNLVYEFDNYRLYIEGMPRFDNKYVLVLHSEDKTINTENKPPNANRVDTKLDVEIVATGKDGVDVIISPTEIKSEQYGTDIIFDLDESQMNLLNGISPNNININIKSVLLKEEQVNIPINLSRGMERTIISHDIMEEQIAKSFDSRVKSVNNAKGFSPEVLANESLKKEYMSLLGKNTKSSINIISKNLDNEYLEAIVQEAIQVKENDDIKVLYKIHKIKANNVNNQWTIYSDEIIK